MTMHAGRIATKAFHTGPDGTWKSKRRRNASEYAAAMIVAFTRVEMTPRCRRSRSGRLRSSTGVGVFSAIFVLLLQAVRLLHLPLVLVAVSRPAFDFGRGFVQLDALSVGGGPAQPF